MWVVIFWVKMWLLVLEMFICLMLFIVFVVFNVLVRVFFSESYLDDILIIL